MAEEILMMLFLIIFEWKLEEGMPIYLNKSIISIFSLISFRRFGHQYINQTTKIGQIFLYRLRKYAKRYKELLSSLTDYTRPIGPTDGDAFEITLTREVFEILSEELFQRIIDKVRSKGFDLIKLRQKSVSQH